MKESNAVMSILKQALRPLKGYVSDDENEDENAKHQNGYWDETPSNKHERGETKTKSKSDLIMPTDRNGDGDSKIIEETYPMDTILDLEASREVALFQAASTNDAKTARILLQDGAIVNCQDSLNHCTALHIACSYGHYAVSELFVREGADTSMRNITGKRAADLAIENGHENLGLFINCSESDID